MVPLLKTLIERLELKLSEQESQSEALGSPSLSRGEVILLGQFSLFCQPAAAEVLPLIATQDIDALVKATGGFESQFRAVVNELGFQYDELSSEVWIPEGAHYNLLYQGSRFTIQALDPISVLVSKAVKAPQKNRILIQEAIGQYGDQLISRLEKYSVDLSFFSVRANEQAEKTKGPGHEIDL
ncbi:MAG TPA: hypothetical protein PLP17_02060 [Oligoflexia bacterium]|nr:hypothetical protein [Oligoflexia bacterium]